MRKAASKLRWPGRSVLVALTLAVGVLGLLLLGSGVKADGPPFNATASTDVSDYDCLANADIESTFNVGDDPWPAAQYEAQISFTPSEWGVPESADIPVGAEVGEMTVNATLGWFNNPCAAAYGGSISFPFEPLLNCSIDTSDTIAYTDADFFQDGDGNGIQGGCDKWPEFLNTMFPGMTPITRHAGFEFIGINVSLSFLTFEPGTSIPTTAAPGVPPFSSDLGYVAMSVLNDPTAPLVKNQITDNCPPLSTETVYYGLTQDNPNTAGVDESGYEWRTNPQYAGTSTFNGYTHSIRDADGDGWDNEIDTCPHVPNAGDYRVLNSGDTDGDGIPDECDPTPDTKNDDADDDDFPNRQDNCPLLDNEDQTDSDLDGIGDACDQDDWNDDGDITDPGEPTGFSPSVPNGENTVVWFASDVDISGPSCVEPGADSDGDGVEDADEANLGSCYDDPCDDEEFCSDTEAADSTPEDTSVAGSCNDGEDNDLDGYIDDVDGGCEDDTDGDGVSDDGEDDLGSDPEDADSTPEDDSVCDVCTDGEDNDGDGDIDAADEGCAAAAVTPTPTVVVGVDTDGDTVPDAEETALGSDPEDADSTPEDASVAGTCTDGVDNDGDGLTDDEDEGCVEPTPSPTVEVEICAPVFPGTYSGLVRIDGQPADAGYEVTASVGGVEWGSAIVSGGRYVMDIPAYMPSQEPCFEPGSITFALNGMTCTASPDAPWASGLRTVDLSCAPAAPPVTPTETATPATPAPTVTPVSPPPSGAGGLSGSGTGLPLWALALASWAGLTIVAGLGTLVAVKRR